MSEGGGGCVCMWGLTYRCIEVPQDSHFGT